MSRKGNRGQIKRPRQINPIPPPPLYECPKHGVQRGIGLQYKDIKICMECMVEFFDANCERITILGDKPEAT